MAANWPPVANTVPPWRVAAATALEGLSVLLVGRGWTDRAPTNAENTSIFNEARCWAGHPVVGRVFVWPDGTTRSFVAVCNTDHDPVGISSRALLIPYDPWEVNDYSRAAL